MCIKWTIQRMSKSSNDRNFVLTFVGISQREITEHFPSLVEARSRYLDSLAAFYEQELQGRFPEINYTFDVYVTSTGKVCSSTTRDQ